MTTRGSRAVDKDVQLTLIPENACFVSLDEKATKITDMTIRENLLRRPTDGRNIREMELQENGLLARPFLKLGNRFVRPLGAARGKVNLRVVCQKSLRFDEPSLRYGKLHCQVLKRTLTVSFPIPELPPTDEHNVEHAGARADVYF